mgnify:CR=1 FL=1
MDINEVVFALVFSPEKLTRCTKVNMDVNEVVFAFGILTRNDNNNLLGAPHGW